MLGRAPATTRTTRPTKLFADNAAEYIFDRLTLVGDEAAQSFVDKRLIVTAAGRVHLLLEPVEQIVSTALRLGAPRCVQVPS
jgi:hypothetical protein